MKQIAAEEREGRWREEEHEEHEGDGHELFMNVSMKGSKEEEGRASEEMVAAAAAAADFACLPGALLPKAAASAPAPVVSVRSCCLFHFTTHERKTAAH